MVDETRVRYKAIVDFTALSRSVRIAKRNLKELREEEERLNAASIKGAGQAAAANDRRAQSMQNLAAASKAQSRSIREATAEFISNSRAARENTQTTQNLATSHRTAATSTREHTTATQQATAATTSLEGVTRRAYRTVIQQAQAAQQAANAHDNYGRSARRNQRELTGLLGAIDKLNSGFKRLGNWRPNFIPPFIALVPIIAGLLGLINPLIAGLGAVGGAAIGFASSLGSVAGAALVVIPALATLLSVVGALKVAFGGIGGAFKAFSAMRKATAAGGGNAKAELTQQEEITRAQEKYARAIQDVAWAQEDLDNERKDYIKRLAELQRAVDKAAQSELRAAANAQLARENYANVLADPGSTKGEKMSAQAGVGEAQDEYSKVIQENKDNAAELQEMKRKGMAGDREVIRAQRALTDAIWAQRDAQLALVNAQNGSNKSLSAQEKAANLYNDALNKLSPSARRFVEILIGMNDAWVALKRNVQEAFFSQFVDDVSRLRDLFGPLQSLLSNAAGALGRFVDNFILLVTSPEWQSDIVLFGENNVPIIENVGAGLLDVFDAFKDIAIVAQEVLLMPFAERFKEWADRFKEWVNAGRESGGLADYLEKVRTRLDQWWRIVKNVGMTLFNFGTAASEFGDWITSGLETTTEGWLASSEEALGPNSKFKQFLEDIKPLVSEIKGLFADFFGWFATEAADTGNIDQMTAIIKAIRDDLGPAIGRLLDAFGDAEIGPKFVEAITTIVEILTELSQSPATDVFFSILNFLLDFLKWCVANPVVGSIIAAIATGFAAIAAVSLVSKFSGLSWIITQLLSLAKGGKTLPGLLRGIGGSLLGMMGITLPGAATAGAAAAGAGGRTGKGAKNVAAKAPAGSAFGRRAPGGGSFKAPRFRGGGIAGLALTALSFLPFGGGIGGGSDQDAAGGAAPTTRREARAAAKPPAKGLGVLSNLGKVAPAVASGAGKGLGVLATLGKGAFSLLGGPVGIASIAGTLAGSAISGSAAKGKAGAGQRVGGDVLGGVATGAGIGALIGSIIPGLGTGIGAGVGAVAGGAISFATADEKDRQTMFKEWGNFFKDIGKWLGDVWTAFSNWLTVDLPGWIGDVWNGFMTWLTVDMPGWIQSVIDTFFTWLLTDLPNWIGLMAGRFFFWLTVDMPAWLQGVWNGFMTWLTVDMPAWLLSVWNGFMTWLTVDMPAWLLGVWNGFMTWLTVDLPAWLQGVWNGFMTWLTIDLPNWIASVAASFWRWLTVDVPRWVSQVAASFWRWLTVDVPNWVAQVANRFWTWLTVDIPKWVQQVADDFWNWLTVDLPGWIEDVAKSFQKWLTEDIPKWIADAFKDTWLGQIIAGLQGGVDKAVAERSGDVPGGIAGSTAKKVMGLMPAGMRISSGYRSPAENRAAGGAAGSLHMDRNNPAVDVVGSKAQMASFATLLGKIGGWRQLYYNGVKAPGVSFWPDHWDHIHVANTGGPVPGTGNSDSVPALLTPGEFILRKRAAAALGASKLNRLNSGLMFNGGGLVPDIGLGMGAPPSNGGGGYGPQGVLAGGGNMYFGDIIVNNPQAERASDSLARTIRKVTYLGGRG